jgi:ABC-2 type transport system permease protein
VATTSATLDRSTTRQYPTVGFGATLASEWTKMISTRSTYIMLGIALVLAVGMTALVSLAVGSTFDDWNAADRASFEPISFSLAGMAFGSILLMVLGVNLVASEYSSGMIRTTLALTPQRGRLLAAKVVLISVVTMVATFIITLLSLGVGMMVLGSYDMPTVSLMDSDALRTIVAITLTSPLFPLIGATLAFLFRSIATPITLVLAIFFAPAMFGPLFPSWWQENVLSLLPSSVADSISLGHIVDSDLYLDPAVAAVVVVAWLVIVIGAAYVTLTRRDA